MDEVKIDGKKRNIREFKNVIAIAQHPEHKDKVIVFSMGRYQVNSGTTVEEIGADVGRIEGDKIIKEKENIGLLQAFASEGNYRITHLKVNPAHEKKGVGETRLVLARNRATEHGMETMSLPGHKEYAAFYKRRGATEVTPDEELTLVNIEGGERKATRRLVKPEDLKLTTHLEFKWMGRRRKR